MEYKDYYKILGVEKTVGIDDLKKKYRLLARKYHPDVNTKDNNAASKFAEINEAYEVLSDAEKRKTYDSLGSDWEQKIARERARKTEQSQNDYFSGGADDDVSEFFKNLFGQGFTNRTGSNFARKGRDIEAEMSISLEDAFFGGVHNLTIGDQKIRLTLKAGIRDRQKIKIIGKGTPGIHGGKNGDLYITFSLIPHSEYILDGINLYLEIPVSIYGALLGTTQEVKTISGTYKIKIPSGTQNGTVFKLKGRGFPVYDKPESHGDLFLKTSLRLPEKLEEREKILFQELAALRNEKVGGKKQ